MKQQRGNKRDKPKGHFVALREYLLSSPAWEALDCNARCLYIELARRYKGPNTTNGRISYSVREAASALRISKDTAKRCFDQLKQCGFVKLTRRSGFNMKGRTAAEWLLTEFPDDTCGIANDATKDFMKYQPEPEKPALERRPNSFHSITTGTLSITTGTLRVVDGSKR